MCLRPVKRGPLLIQPLSFQSFPHSFTQWTTTKSFPFNIFHTLSIVMGGVGVPPSENLNRYFKYSPNDQIFCRPFFSTTYEMPVFYPLCFDIHPSNAGYPPPRVLWPDARTSGRLDVQTPFLPPPVPLRRNPLGATMAIGATFLRSPGKQLRTPRCLRIVSGHRGQLDASPRCKSCLGHRSNVKCVLTMHRSAGWPAFHQRVGKAGSVRLG